MKEIINFFAHEHMNIMLESLIEADAIGAAKVFIVLITLRDSLENGLKLEDSLLESSFYGNVAYHIVTDIAGIPFWRDLMLKVTDRMVQEAEKP